MSTPSSLEEHDHESEFERRFKANERARVITGDPLFPLAMQMAREKAAANGRQVRAKDLEEAMAKVRVEQGPRPPRPPQAVALLDQSSTAAKERVDVGSSSVVPDRYR